MSSGATAKQTTKEVMSYSKQNNAHQKTRWVQQPINYKLDQIGNTKQALKEEKTKPAYMSTSGYTN